ncbi:Acyl-CoA dehydrogenase [Halioglobus japonicus]|nr:Acyl-CoA dehydrogenase [Halioglobus japonicus]
MDFSLSEEQILLQDSVEKYVREHCGVERHRSLCNSELGFERQAWQQFAELGWLSVPFSEALGGIDGRAIDLMVVGEALGKGLVREPFLSTVVTCGGLLQRGGSEEQQGRYIPDIIAGNAQWAFAFAETQSGYDMCRVDTVAQKSGSDYVLSGNKIAVLNAHCADYLIVTARSPERTGEASGITLFIVDTTSPGVERENFVAVDGSRGAHVQLHNVQLGAKQILGEEEGGLPLVEAVIDTTIVALGAEALGAMQALLEATVEYTKTRKQFGQAISKFQALQHRMAEMYLKVEETRSLLLNAAIALDAGSEESAAACAALKVKVSEAGKFIAQQAVQLHGGIGMTDELCVGHHYKRLMVLAKLYGDEAYYLQKYAISVAARVA